MDLLRATVGAAMFVGLLALGMLGLLDWVRLL